MLKVKDTGIDIEEYSAGYVRISTAEDRQKLGYKAQKRILADNNIDKIYAEKFLVVKMIDPNLRKPFANARF